MVQKIFLIGVLIFLVGAFFMAFAQDSVIAIPLERYIVQPGDTLWMISKHFYNGDPRKMIHEIREANHLESANIYPGQSLWIPRIYGGCWKWRKLLWQIP